MQSNSVNAGSRLASMLLDHTITTFIVGLFAAPAVLLNLFFQINRSINKTEFNPFGHPIVLVWACLSFALYFCKDVVKGRSFAKKILNIQVVSDKSGEVASAFQTVIRNFFCILWPVEVVVVLFNPQRRIGDFVAGTRVVTYDAVKQSVPVNKSRIFFAYLLSCGSLFIVSMLFYFWIGNLSRSFIPEIVIQSDPSSINRVPGEDLKNALQKAGNINFDEIRVNYFDSSYNYRGIVIDGFFTSTKYVPDKKECSSIEDTIKKIITDNLQPGDYYLRLNFLYTSSANNYLKYQKNIRLML